MTTDLEFFEEHAPIVLELYDIFTAIGWALLLGNLVFQAMKSMMAGLGVEAEPPASLIARTSIFAFLLLFSRQILEIGLGLGSNMINLIGLPREVLVTMPEADIFVAALDQSWFIAGIMGFIIGFSIIKMFFAIGERYVIVCVMVLFAPLGFAMGGSKATKDLATGYIRMFASMVLLLVLNVVFLKLVFSVLSIVPTPETVVPWVVLVVAISRVAQKADNMVARIGLNPMISSESTGGGRGGAIALVMLAARSLINGVKTSVSGSSGGGKSGGSKPAKAGNTNHSSSKNAQVGTGKQNTANKQDSSNSQSNSSTTNQNVAGNNQNSNSNNQTQQKSSNTVNGGDNKQQLNSQQKLNNTANLKSKQGGKPMDSNQNKPATTQINTDRFGKSVGSSEVNVNNKNNNTSANQSNNSQSAVNQGSNSNVTANKSSNSQTSANNGRNSVPAVQPQGSPSHGTQGKNSGTANQTTNVQSVTNQGKNATSSVQGNPTQSSSNQGKNSVSANSVKNVQSNVTQGKNTQPTSNQGKKGVPQNQSKNAQSPVAQGKNSSVKPPTPVKTQQSCVVNGKNDIAPVGVNGKADVTPAVESNTVNDDMVNGNE